MFSIESGDSESLRKWFDEDVGDGENSILVYPNLQTFRQIYTKYVKDHLVRADDDGLEADDDNNNNNNANYNPRRNNEQSKSRIILIATFYETINSVKHHLSAVGVKDIEALIDNGSLVIVDTFRAYHPDIDGMKKLVASLSERARKEGRPGLTAIADVGYFFLFGGDGTATQLIKYESSLSPKIEGCNIRGFSCYHAGNYVTLNDSQKKELAAQGQKKLLEVKEIANTAT